MKIAMIEPVGSHGGMDYYDLSLCNGLLECGLDVMIYTSKINTSLHNSVEIIESFKGVFGRDPILIRAFKWILGLHQSLLHARIRGVDLIHVHLFDTGYQQRFTIRLSKMFGFKVVATMHDVESLYRIRKASYINHVLAMLDGIIVHNDSSKKELSKFIKNQPLQIMIIPHMHYINFVGKTIHKSTARAQLNLPGDGPLFLFFGQIKQVKGLDTALQAMAEIRDTIPNARLLIAGRPWKTTTTEYIALINKFHLENNVIWHLGYIPNEKVDFYYYASDAVLLPYRKIYQSGVLLMAMSYGIPVIASDLPGMRDAILENVNGLLFAVDDPIALSQRMLSVIKNKDFAERIGQQGRAHVKNHHDIRRISESTAEFYRSVCS